MWNWLGGVERRENQIDGEHSCSLFFFLGDVVKDRLCFPVLYSFVFSKWTTMSSCFLETRKRNSLRGVGTIGHLQDQFSCFPRFHDYRAYDKHLFILENSALKFPKVNGLKFQKQSWILETFTLGGSDFSTQIPPPALENLFKVIQIVSEFHLQPWVFLKLKTTA